MKSIQILKFTSEYSDSRLKTFLIGDLLIKAFKTSVQDFVNDLKKSTS